MLKLKENSIHIVGNITVCWPQHGDRETILDMSEARSKFNGCYATNNSTICFVDNHEVFVTPYTRKVMATLWNNGFSEKRFYVPFSNWDYPKFEKTRWYQLCEKAQQASYNDYEADCADWCDEHGIGELSEETLKNCFKIPRDGLPVRRFNYEVIYRPLGGESCMDHSTVEKLGRYCYNNGKVAFVYRDGHTYVTKGYDILNELGAAGYRRGSLFVPFSNGEQITDSYLAEQWERIQ